MSLPDPGAPTTGGDDDVLYDRYLAEAAAGRVDEPEAFCMRHGSTSEELLQDLRVVHAMLGRTRALSPEAPPEREQSIGGYRLLRKLGEGGMGVVYLAEDRELRRPIALKVIRPGLESSRTAIERFRREALAVARLQHPNLVTVHAVGEEDGARFLAMEYIAGQSLSDILATVTGRGEVLPVPRALRWGTDLARCVQVMHDAGIVHRDIKPSNILVTPDDRPILTDFGLARDLLSEDLTLTIDFAGSPHYAAPEQIDATRGDIDARTDVYALGVTLYECVTGSVPFSSTSIERVFHSVLHEEQTSPRARNPALSRDIEVVLQKATEKDPARRYPTAAAFADDLDAALEFRPIAAIPPGPVRRMERLMRRNLAATLAVLGALLAVGAAVAVLLAQGWSAQHERLREAGDLLAEAGQRIAGYESQHEELYDLESVAVQLEHSLEDRYLQPEEYEVMRERSAEAASLSFEREAEFYRVLEVLRRAEQLAPDIEGVGSLRAELYLARYQEASLARDTPRTRLYAALARAEDAPKVLALIDRTTTLSLRTDPPGARVYAFHYEQQSEVADDGEERLVAVPDESAPGSPPPGTWMLRVESSLGELQPGDHVLEVAGHPIEGCMLVAVAAGEVAHLDRLVSIDGRPVRDAFDVETLGGLRPGEREGQHELSFRRGARTIVVQAESVEAAGLEVVTPEELLRAHAADGIVHREGRTFPARLPAGLRTRTTASPLLVSEHCLLGTTPLEQIPIALGEHLFLLVHPGREIQRLPLRALHQQAAGLEVRLLPQGTTPEGFVRIVHSEHEPFWMQEREVTAAEWLEFLHAPEVAATLEPDGDSLVPRRGRTDWYWERGADGRFTLPPDWSPDWPVIGISWHDAQAYADWRSAQAERAGLSQRYFLPTREQWLIAANPAGHRTYTYGSVFRPRWTKTCFSRPFADPEPVMRFPVDETPYGLRDMGGSAFEWLDEWFVERKGLRALAGGAWGRADPKLLHIEADYGLHPATVGGELGLRLGLQLEEK